MFVTHPWLTAAVSCMKGRAPAKARAAPLAPWRGARWTRLGTRWLRQGRGVLLDLMAACALHGRGARGPRPRGPEAPETAGSQREACRAAPEWLQGRDGQRQTKKKETKVSHGGSSQMEKKGWERD